ncbi:MAG: site-specific integrase, partial [Proteobacteria bacterium]|nr:site-specific integrase [Pseudomonadota bacterium]
AGNSMIDIAAPKLRFSLAGYLLSLASGMRRGEVCALKWDCIEGMVIHVRRSLYQRVGGELELKAPKTKNSIRKVTMPSKLENELRAQRARQSASQ